MADTPFGHAVIAGLQERIKALAPARLEGFAKWFCSAFQVPDSQPSLAGVVTTSPTSVGLRAFSRVTHDPVVLGVQSHQVVQLTCPN
jgi:hypothetical protein